MQFAVLDKGLVRGEVLYDISFKLCIQFLSCLTLSAKPAWDYSLCHMFIFCVLCWFSLPLSSTYFKNSKHDSKTWYNGKHNSDLFYIFN